jgi:hypothetical protein
MRGLRVAAPPSPLGVSTPRDVAGLPPVLSARLAAQACAQAWPWVTRRQKTSISVGAAFPKAARA